MTEEELHEWVDTLDMRQYENLAKKGFPVDPGDYNKRKEIENQHKKMLEDILFLKKYFFEDYELNPLGFMNPFLMWMDQFNGIIEGLGDNTLLSDARRYALILALKVMFFNRDQFLTLLKELWDNIKKELLILAVQQHNIPAANVMFETELANKQLDVSQFVPLCPESPIGEFRRHCLPEGRDDLLIENMETIIPPKDLRANDFSSKLNAKYKDKRNLFILEDFSGSGTTTTKKNIKQLILMEDCPFQNIYFCPAIITEQAHNKIGGLVDLAKAKNKNFKVINGVFIGKDYTIVNDDDNLGKGWTKEEKKALRLLSEKYFQTHFKGNKSLYFDFLESNPKRPAPFGFKNGGLALVLYSNCPNNSLPVIWAGNNGWQPLFRRKEKYNYNNKS